MFVCFRKRKQKAGTGNGNGELVPSHKRNEPWSNIALPPFKENIIDFRFGNGCDWVLRLEAPPPPRHPACRPGVGGIPNTAPPTSSQAMWGLAAQLSPPGFPPCNLKLPPPGHLPAVLLQACYSPHPVLLLARSL
jgi:hypothetical protein